MSVNVFFCGVLMVKSRLAPMRPMTKPRLGLSAAILAAKMDELIRKENGMPIKRSVFWTDSNIVSHYLRNDNKRFQTFTANRIAAIQEISNPMQWRHVASKLNPADDASRRLRADELLQKDRRFSRPAFL